MKDLSEFEAYLKNRRSPCTVKAYLWSMSKYFGQTSDISSDSIKAFMHHLETTKVKPQTIRRHKAAIKYYLKFIDKAELMPAYEAPRCTPFKRKPLSKEQMASLLLACDNLQETVMISLLYGLALRIGELLLMKVEDFNPKEGSVSVHTEKQRTFEDVIDEVPISDELLGLVSEYILESGVERGPLFRDMNYKRALDMVHKLCKRAGIPQVGTHIFRHGRCSDLAEHRIDIFSLKSFMRHKNISSTMVYVHTKPESVRRAVEEASRE